MNPNHNYDNIAINALQIRSCRVDHTNSQSFSYNYDNISDIATQLHAYLDRVESITFFFDNPNIPFHYLILRKTNEQRGRFIAEFFHYYNRAGRQIELSEEDKLRDFASVINFMRRHQWLRDNLHRLIIDPFYVPPVMT